MKSLLAIFFLFIFWFISACGVNPDDTRKNGVAVLDTEQNSSSEEAFSQNLDESTQNENQLDNEAQTPASDELQIKCNEPKLTVHFNLVKPVLDEYCVICHSSDNQAGGVAYDGDYNELTKDQWAHAVKEVKNKRMPPSGNSINPDSYNVLLAWESAGFSETPIAVDNPACAEENAEEMASNNDINSISCNDSVKAPVAKRLVRLTNTQYINTINTIFADKLNLDFSALPVDLDVEGFTSFAETLGMSSRRLNAYILIAGNIGEQVFTRITNENEKFSGLLNNCSSSQHNCNRQYLTSIANAAFRSPVSNDEIDVINQIYNNTRSRDVKEAFVNSIRYIFLNSSFLYRHELGAENGELSAYELAETISYFLTDFPPDAGLLKKAEDGTLLSTPVLGQEVMRLLDSTNGQDFLSRFIVAYYGLDKIANHEVPEGVADKYSANIINYMVKEVRLFVDHVFHSSATLRDLLLSNKTFINQKLAKLYGIDGLEGNGFVETILPDNQRSGLFTRSAFIHTYSEGEKTSVFRRGAVIREKVLCQQLAAPPDNVPPLPNLENDSLSKRQIIEIHTNSNTVCKSCHEAINHIGFAYGHYDDFGAFLDAPSYGTVNGYLNYTRDIDGDFEDAIDLNKKLAKSQQVSDCFASNVFRLAYGKDPEAENMCELKKIVDGFAPDKSIKDLLINIISSQYYKERR